LSAVVSDSGPLIHLAQIGKLHLLKDLFGCIHVTASVKGEVIDEGIQRNRPEAEVVAKALNDGWLKVEVLPERLLISAAKLAKGENISSADAEIILLSKKKKALFLVDDIPLADLAEMYDLRAWDTWTLLLESQSRKLFRLAEVESAIEELGKKKFRLNPKQVEEILKASKTIEEKKNGSKVLCDPS
jgi:uncharacterized protein